MPEIARFYGIIIKMFFKPKEHEPSHIHAIYNEYVGLFNIKTFEMFEGDLPKKAQELVTEWLSLHSDEFDDGYKVLYDVKDDIKTLPSFRALVDVYGLFKQAQLDTSRTCVYWNDKIDLASDSIYEYGKAA